MLDVIVAGAGPAGSIAARALARAGARVLIVDRDTFPRPKLCGDTLNPGAVAALTRLGLTGGPLDRARRLAGMLVTGPASAVEARYRDGPGLAVTRDELDAWLLEEAIRAGARFESRLSVRMPLLDERAPGRAMVRGVVVSPRGSSETRIRLPATVTIAADGRRSTIARALALSCHPRRPRRWAFGAYVHGVGGTSDLGEMHIRPDCYFGIAPIGGDRCNVCLVMTPRAGAGRPLDLIRRVVAREPALRDRFADARFEPEVRALGPLAVDVRMPGSDGVLLAGDAAGFVDPMTGDGLHLAIRGAELAAGEAARVLDHGDFRRAVEGLDLARRESLAGKQRFNRLLRRVTASPAAINLGDWGARVAPGMIRWVVNYAGDAA